MTEKNKSEPDNSVENFVLYSVKQLSDRTNIIIAANSFLFMPFATLLTSTAITGYLVAIPIIICIVGIGLNAILGFTNIIQIGKISKSLEGVKSSFIKTCFKSDAKDYSTLYNIFNKYAPILLITAWSLCIVFFILQNTIGIV